MRHIVKPQKGTERLHNKPENKIYGSLTSLYIDDEIRVRDFKIKEKETKSQEFDERIKIQKIIVNGVYSGTPLLEIIQQLNSDERYKKYSQFFEIWINDQKNKKQEIGNKVKELKHRGKNKGEIEEFLRRIEKWNKVSKYYKDIIEEVWEQDENEKGTDLRYE